MQQKMGGVSKATFDKKNSRKDGFAELGWSKKQLFLNTRCVPSWLFGVVGGVCGILSCLQVSGNAGWLKDSSRMPSRCIAAGCPQFPRHLTPWTTVLLFKFPKDPKLRKQVQKKTGNLVTDAIVCASQQPHQRGLFWLKARKRKVFVLKLQRRQIAHPGIASKYFLSGDIISEELIKRHNWKRRLFLLWRNWLGEKSNHVVFAHWEDCTHFYFRESVPVHVFDHVWLNSLLQCPNFITIHPISKNGLTFR